MPKDERFELRATIAWLSEVDAWRDAHPDRPSRGEAVRQLVRMGLSGAQVHSSPSTEQAAIRKQLTPTPTRPITTPTYSDVGLGHIRTPYGSRLKKR